MKLLVSVRTVEEAEAALAGGCDLVDIKEPFRGALGRADDRVIADIVRLVAGRRPISAAMGELNGFKVASLPERPLTFLKFGLAGCQGRCWQSDLLRCREATDINVVPTVYADAELAEAPTLSEITRFVREEAFTTMLIDTLTKDGRSLFDWVTEQDLCQLTNSLRQEGIDLALAGSLSQRHLGELHRIGPAWLAVRGAVCRGSARTGEIDRERVRELKVAISSSEN